MEIIAGCKKSQMSWMSHQNHSKQIKFSSEINPKYGKSRLQHGNHNRLQETKVSQKITKKLQTTTREL